MDIPATLNLLESAILRVAETEYRRFSSGLTPGQAAARVTRALESMAGLRDGVPPDYNEWDALFYLTWYQPRQVNLTQLVASHVFAKGPRGQLAPAAE